MYVFRGSSKYHLILYISQKLAVKLTGAPFWIVVSYNQLHLANDRIALVH